jgi:hypothetical protein
MDVTRTSARQGKFETRFWHKVYEEEVGRVKGHFGPINTSVIFSAPFIPLLTLTQNCGPSRRDVLRVGRGGWVREGTSFRRLVFQGTAVWVGGD